mgnify:FL=1
MSQDDIDEERDKVVEDTINTFRHAQIESEGKDPAKGEEIAEEAKKKNKATLSASGDTKKTRDGDDSDVGRPEEDVDYGTQRAPRGRDPLGSETRRRDVKNRDRRIKINTKEIVNSLNFGKKSQINEHSLLDENNLLSEEETKA